MEKLPLLSADLIELLDKQYPHRCADASWTDREIWMKAGERRLIDSLKSRLEGSDEDILNTKLLEE